MTGHEGGAFMNGISALIKETHRAPSPLPHVRTWESCPHQTLNLLAPCSCVVFQPPELGNKWLSLYVTQSRVICDSSLNGLAQSVSTPVIFKIYNINKISVIISLSFFIIKLFKKHQLFLEYTENQQKINIIISLTSI